MSDIKNDLYNADMQRIKRNRERLTYINDLVVAMVGYAIENMDRVFYDSSRTLKVVTPTIEVTMLGDYFKIEYEPSRQEFSLTIGNSHTETSDKTQYSLHDFPFYKDLRVNLVGYLKDRLSDMKELISEFESSALFCAAKWFRNEQTILSFTSDSHTTSFTYIVTREATHILSHYDKKLSLQKYAELNPEMEVIVPEESSLTTEHSVTDVIAGASDVVATFNNQVIDILVETGNWNVLK